MDYDGGDKTLEEHAGQYYRELWDGDLIDAFGELLWMTTKYDVSRTPSTGYPEVIGFSGDGKDMSVQAPDFEQTRQFYNDIPDEMDFATRAYELLVNPAEVFRTRNYAVYRHENDLYYLHENPYRDNNVIVPMESMGDIPLQEIVSALWTLEDSPTAGDGVDLMERALNDFMVGTAGDMDIILDAEREFGMLRHRQTGADRPLNYFEVQDILQRM